MAGDHPGPDGLAHRPGQVHSSPRPRPHLGDRTVTARRAVARSIDVPVIAVSEANGDHRRLPQRPQAHDAVAGWLLDARARRFSTLQRFRSRYTTPSPRHPARNGDSSRCVMSCRLCSRAKMSVALPRRSRAISSNSGPTAASSTCRPTSSAPASPRAWGWSCATIADDRAIAHLRSLSADALMDLPKVWRPAPARLRRSAPHRAGAARVPPLAPAPAAVVRDLIERLVARFGSLPEILSASAAELESVEASAPPPPATSATAWRAWSRPASSSDTNDAVIW